MADINKKIPSPEEVRKIFNDTYNVFFKKYKDISSPEQWAPLMQEMHRIDQQYGCDLCRQILIELVKVIQNEFLKKQGGS